MITKNDTSVFHKSFTIYVFFRIYPIMHHLCDSPSSLCDPPKDPNVQYQLQIWALNKIVSPNI